MCVDVSLSYYKLPTVLELLPVWVLLRWILYVVSYRECTLHVIGLHIFNASLLHAKYISVTLLLPKGFYLTQFSKFEKISTEFARALFMECTDISKPHVSLIHRPDLDHVL